MLIVTLFQALELGLIYSILALGVFLSFRTLNTPDLTVDGSIVTGAAVSAVMCTWAADMPPVVQVIMSIAGLLLAFVFGMGAGAVTALLSTKLKIQPLLAGILVMLGVYSINLRIQWLAFLGSSTPPPFWDFFTSGKANINLNNMPTIYKAFAQATGGFRWSSIVLGVLITMLIIVLLFAFLKTREGFALRATGDNEEMVRAAGISSDNMKILGLSLSNGLVGMAGGMLAQYQAYSDIGMGTGMVVIGLASVIIGEVVFGTTNLMRRLIAVALGAIAYRMVIGIALYMGMPPIDLKLVSAVIVTIALSMGLLGENFSLIKPKNVRPKGKTVGGDDNA